MIEFLGFVVEQALLNQRDSINERLIGQVVFQKPSDWEPSLDSIVRSEGRRLRAKLSQYYEGLGRNDEVRIQIPKGTYVPEFSFNQDPLPKSAVETSPALAALSTPTKPSVTGLPILIAALICACLVLIVFAVSRGKTGDLNSRPAFTTASFTTDFGKEFSPAISPDGKTIAYVWDDGSGTPDIFLRGIDDKTSHRLNPIADERLFPSWSHDGQKMAFIAVRGDKLDIQIDSLKDDSLRTVVSISKAVGQWTEDSSPLLGCPGPVWSADDQSSIFEDRDTATDTSGLVKVNFNGAKEAQITSTKGEFHDLYPRWSPNGENIAFVRYSSHGVGELFITSLSGAEPARQLTQDLKTIQGLAWDHDGKQLVFASNRLGTFQLWSLRIDTHAINPLPTNTIWASEPSIASDGNWLVFVQASTNWNIWRRTVKGVGADQRLIASSGRNYDARYSPDNQRIAFVSDRSGHMELWTTDTSGRDPIQLTHLNNNWLGGVAWSPDGAIIAFDARPKGHSAIYVISARGGESQLLDANSFEERMPAWSESGDTLYFNSNRDGTTAIFAHSLKDGSTRLVSPPRMFAVQETGNTLFFSNRSGDMFHSNKDGTQFGPLQGHLKASPVMSWVTIGKSLYISGIDPQTQKSNLSIFSDGRTTKLSPLTGILVPNAPDIALSSDEKLLLYARQESAQSSHTIRRMSR